MAARVGRTAHADEAALADRRWLALVAGVFLLVIAACALVVWVFRVTGPHPEMWKFLHQLRRMARWVLPRWSHRWRAD